LRPNLSGNATKLTAGGIARRLAWPRPSGRDCLTFFHPLEQSLEGSHLLPLGLAIGDAVADMLAILGVDLAAVMLAVEFL
jgi:hypothetical protein